jgi:hypothetical protein
MSNQGTHDRHANAVGSVEALQPFLPLSIYTSLGTNVAARAELLRVSVLRNASPQSAVLAFHFFYNGLEYTSPCSMGWQMVEHARQTDNPGEKPPRSRNFDGWRRTKVIVKDSPELPDSHPSNYVLTLGDYFSTDVRYGIAVWAPGQIAPCGNHDNLLAIIQEAEDNAAGIKRVITGPPVFTAPPHAVEHKKRTRESAQRDARPGAAAAPRRRRLRAVTRVATALPAEPTPHLLAACHHFATCVEMDCRVKVVQPQHRPSGVARYDAAFWTQAVLWFSQHRFQKYCASPGSSGAPGHAPEPCNV